MKVLAHLLPAGGEIPNHPRWPLLVYPGAVTKISAEVFEELFTRNRWPAAWRNGVHPFHHNMIVVKKDQSRRTSNVPLANEKVRAALLKPSASK